MFVAQVHEGRLKSSDGMSRKVAVVWGMPIVCVCNKRWFENLSPNRLEIREQEKLAD